MQNRIDWKLPVSQPAGDPEPRAAPRRHVAALPAAADEGAHCGEQRSCLTAAQEVRV